MGLNKIALRKFMVPKEKNMIYVIEGDGRKRPGAKITCEICGKKFITRKTYAKKKRAKYCSRECMALSQRNRVEKKCDYCGKIFERIESSIKKSRTGLVFCSRACKDFAQRLINGKKFSIMRPKHYGTAEGRNDYRDKAFAHYPIKCANIKCGYEEDDRLLEVHHRDGNRNNNEIEKLAILCGRCHRGITI